jgi:nucleotide-binding universal stress UspA family protein
MKLERILVPVDGSEYSARAVDYSLSCAEQYQSEVILLHCHKPIIGYAVEPDFDDVKGRILEKADQLLSNYKDLYERKGIRHREIISDPPPAQAICQIAKEENIDTIIMGTRGKTDWEGLLVGSVTHKVLQLSPCPVLVVP